MVVQIPKSPIVLSSTVDLTVQADDAYIGNDETAIRGIGIGHVVKVIGSVGSTLDAIWLGNDISVQAGNSVEIAKTGKVEGETYEGVMFWGSSNTLVNAGEIISGDDSAVIFASTALSGSSTIKNSGKITGGDFGIEIQANVNDLVVLTNTGTITGGSGSYGRDSSDLSDNIDRITNSGTMTGTILLGGGDDRYLGKSGKVTGIVHGGDGSDTLVGGSEKNDLRGDDGFDFITGGFGGDTLTGGDNADRFIFSSIKESTVASTGRDFIKDFSSSEFDLLDLHSIDANTGKKGNQRFDFIDDDKFSKTAGELHIEFKSGDTILSGDVNGDGKADFAVAFDGPLRFDDGDFIL